MTKATNTRRVGILRFLAAPFKKSKKRCHYVYEPIFTGTRYILYPKYNPFDTYIFEELLGYVPSSFLHRVIGIWCAFARKAPLCWNLAPRKCQWPPVGSGCSRGSCQASSSCSGRWWMAALTVVAGLPDGEGTLLHRRSTGCQLLRVTWHTPHYPQDDAGALCWHSCWWRIVVGWRTILENGAQKTRKDDGGFEKRRCFILGRRTSWSVCSPAWWNHLSKNGSHFPLSRCLSSVHLREEGALWVPKYTALKAWRTEVWNGLEAKGQQGFTEVGASSKESSSWTLLASRLHLPLCVPKTAMLVESFPNHLPLLLLPSSSSFIRTFEMLLDSPGESKTLSPMQSHLTSNLNSARNLYSLFAIKGHLFPGSGD